MAEIEFSQAHERDPKLWPVLQTVSEQILAQGEVTDDGGFQKQRAVWRAAGAIGLDFILERPVLAENTDYRLRFESYTEGSRPWGIYRYDTETGGISAVAGELPQRTINFATDNKPSMEVHETQLLDYLRTFATEGSYE